MAHDTRPVGPRGPLSRLLLPEEGLQGEGGGLLLWVLTASSELPMEELNEARWSAPLNTPEDAVEDEWKEDPEWR